MLLLLATAVVESKFSPSLFNGVRVQLHSFLQQLSPDNFDIGPGLCSKDAVAYAHVHAEVGCAAAEHVAHAVGQGVERGSSKDHGLAKRTAHFPVGFFDGAQPGGAEEGAHTQQGRVEGLQGGQLDALLEFVQRLSVAWTVVEAIGVEVFLSQGVHIVDGVELELVSHEGVALVPGVDDGLAQGVCDFVNVDKEVPIDERPVKVAGAFSGQEAGLAEVLAVLQADFVALLQPASHLAILYPRHGASESDGWEEQSAVGQLGEGQRVFESDALVVVAAVAVVGEVFLSVQRIEVGRHGPSWTSLKGDPLCTVAGAGDEDLTSEGTLPGVRWGEQVEQGQTQDDEQSEQALAR